VNGHTELVKQIRSITFRVAYAASSGPYGARKSADGLNRLPKPRAGLRLNPGASSGVFKTPQEPNVSNDLKVR